MYQYYRQCDHYLVISSRVDWTACNAFSSSSTEENEWTQDNVVFDYRMYYIQVCEPGTYFNGVIITARVYKKRLIIPL